MGIGVDKTRYVLLYAVLGWDSQSHRGNTSARRDHVLNGTGVPLSVCRAVFVFFVLAVAIYCTAVLPECAGNATRRYESAWLHTVDGLACYKFFGDYSFVPIRSEVRAEKRPSTIKKSTQ